LSTAGTVTEVVTGALLALFTLIFLLVGGRNIWQFVTQIAPSTVRQRLRDAGAASFHSLTGYVRATSVVALVDAVGIGTGLAIMGIPLALPGIVQRTLLTARLISTRRWSLLARRPSAPSI